MWCRSTLPGFAIVMVLLQAGDRTTLRAGAPEKPKQLLAIKDLYLFDAPRTPVLAKDGKRLAYVRTWIDAASKQERHSLWLVEGSKDKKRPLEKDEPDARAPVFSPDGKWLAFLSTRPRPKGWKQIPPTPLASDAATDIWLIPAEGGLAMPLAGPEKPYGRVFNDGFYGRLAFSPDSKKLVFVADDGIDPRTPEEIEADVLVVRPDQGEGYTGYGPAQIWVAELDPKPGKFAASKIERLTKDAYWYGDPQWSPDGKFLAVHANRTDDQESVRYSINKNFDIWAIDLKTHQLKQLTRGGGPEVSPRFSPDGKRLVCLSIPRKGSHRDVFNFVIITLDKDSLPTKTLFDHHGPSANKPPHAAPAFPLPLECWDGDEHIVYNAEQTVLTTLNRVAVTTGQGTLLELVGPKGHATWPTDSLPGRIFKRQQMTPASNAFLKQRQLGQDEVIWWNNDEGKKIEGVLTLPPPAAGKAPHKLVVYPHGGPHSRSVLGFNFTAQIFAAHGYAVLQPNFRGSSGYGQKFIDADRFDFGGGDMRDILTGIDHVVKEKWADPKRQFVYGISYGGYMTTWLVGHTKQFKAAVAQNAVTDLNAMWGLSDIQSWTEWEFGGKPWQVPAAMSKHSPLTYADKVETPTLILHAKDDRRCPLPMGKMFYQALLARKVPTQMVIYPDEGHGIRQPKHQVDVLQRTLAWFAKHDTN